MTLSDPEHEVLAEGSQNLAHPLPDNDPNCLYKNRMTELAETNVQTTKKNQPIEEVQTQLLLPESLAHHKHMSSVGVVLK